MRTSTKLGLTALVAMASLAMTATAKPQPDTSIGEQLPDIEEVLRQAGWTITPEMSAAYSQPGDIFDENNALLKKGSSCFDAEVLEGAYASMEVNRSLEAGVRMRVFVAGARADMGIEKKLVFDTPTHRQIPRLDLTPNESCRQSVQRARDQGQDISQWYVITEALSAVVQKQECGSYSAKAGGFVVSGDAEVQQLCEQTSLAPVAVAYKIRPVADWFGQVERTNPPVNLGVSEGSVAMPLSSGVRDGSASSSMGEICVGRKTGYYGSALPGHLEMDEKQVAQITNRRVVCFPATTGSHRVKVMISIPVVGKLWGTIDVNISVASTAHLEVVWKRREVGFQVVEGSEFQERFGRLPVRRQ
jgi:hypothetical protein